MPANRTPIGWALPNKATAIASNPMPAEKPGVALPNTPAIWHAPARPAKRPAILIASTIVIAGFILLSTACSGGGADSNKKVADPCRDDSSDRIGKVEEYQNEENETLRGIRTHTKRKVVFFSGLTVILMGFQAWLGAIVVYSVLQPVKITIHMLMALVILSLMVYLISLLPASSNEIKRTYDNRLHQVLKLAIILSLIQITLGTQVRQLIDEISSSFNDMHRDLWIGLTGMTFKIHRSFAISLVLINGLLFFRNYKLKFRFQLVNFVFGIVLLEVLSGIVLTYFDMMSLMQPIHLVAASLIFVFQSALYFQLQKAKST